MRAGMGEGLRPGVEAAWCLVALMAAGGTAQAQSYQDALMSARRVDAQYASQVAAVQNRRLQADQAGTAYYPSASFTYSRSDATNSDGDTKYVTLTQPLFSWDRYLNRKQATPLAQLADAELQQSDNDLALRVFSAMAEIVRTREQIRALGVQIDGLDEQLRRSTRMRELGQGTVTEVSDFQVRVAIAQANRVSLRNNLQAAERNFTLVSGLRANTPTLQVTVPPWQDTRPLDALVEEVRETAPTARAGKLNVQLAEIAAKRVTAQYLPQVVAQVSKGDRTGNPIDSTPRVAITLTAPIGLSPYYDYQRAANSLLQTEEQLRYAQDIAGNEMTRLHLAVNSLRDEIGIRQQAVEGARLSVDANVKSYQGGVKTNIDVITSYQTLADAEVALVNSRLSLAETELRLNLLVPPTETAMPAAPGTNAPRTSAAVAQAPDEPTAVEALPVPVPVPVAAPLSAQITADEPAPAREPAPEAATAAFQTTDDTTPTQQ